MNGVTSPEGLDLDAVGPWLAAQRLVDPAPIEAVRLAGGLSNVTYLVTQGDRELVIRRPPLGHVMPTAHDMGREFTVLNGVTRGGFPAPEPLAYCDDAAVIGAKFLVMEYVPGRIISSDSAAAALTPEEASALSAELVDVLADLHAIDASAVGLADLGRPDGFLARQVKRWAGQWELSKTRELPAIDELLVWLRGRVSALPADLPWSIVHGDYRLDNLLVDEHNEVAAVLDWEMATLGDPLTDLGLLLVYLRLTRLDPTGLGNAADAPGFLDESRMLEVYREASGRDLVDMGFYVGLASFKLAVILEGIHYRHSQGQTVGQGFDMLGAAVEPLIAAGIAALQSAEEA